MSKRRRTPKLTPLWLPYIRDRLADWKDDLGMRTATALGRPTGDGSWRIGDVLRSSPIWWVSRDMGTLAADTADAGDLPGVDPPSDTGIMFFQDSLPFRLQDYPEGRSCTVDAIQWSTVRPGEKSFLFAEVYSREQSYVQACDPHLPVGYVTLAHGDRPSILTDVLKAAWALSRQPSISETRTPKATPLDRMPARYAREEIPRVKMLILRENLHRPGEKAEPSEKTREYTHRWIVRGFWREQPYGKGHALRRRQWIPPFVKGPADKPLIRKETVRILR